MRDALDFLANLLWWFVIFGAIGLLIGQKKNRPLAGLAWAMLLGPIGWLLVWLGPTVEKSSGKAGYQKTGAGKPRVIPPGKF